MLNTCISTIITGVLNCYNMELDDNLPGLKHLHLLLLLLICLPLVKYHRSTHVLHHEVISWLILSHEGVLCLTAKYTYVVDDYIQMTLSYIPLIAFCYCKLLSHMIRNSVGQYCNIHYLDIASLCNF